MFVTYFPELVAGPIVRASVFLPQMNRSLRPSWSRTFLGLQVVLLGVTKKLVVADRLAYLVDPIFANPAAFTPFTVTSAVVGYSLQIYCDFSGYSDIAIGVSKIIGFDLPENFNMPYLATSLTDFWRRWHMTLSGWLRDYLYIPLGGNRHGRLKTYRNLMITMLLGGLWHGASWNFVFWGLLHGFGLAVNHWWTRDRKGAARSIPPAVCRRSEERCPVGRDLLVRLFGLDLLPVSQSGYFIADLAEDTSPGYFGLAVVLFAAVYVDRPSDRGTYSRRNRGAGGCGYRVGSPLDRAPRLGGAIVFHEQAAVCGQTQ